MEIIIVSTGLARLRNCRPLSGGIESVVYSMAHHLSMRGYSVTIIDSIKGFNGGKCPYNIVSVPRTCFREQMNFVRSARVSRLLQIVDQIVFSINSKRLFKRISFSKDTIIHLHDPVASSFLLNYLVGRGYRIVYTLHNALYLSSFQSYGFKICSVADRKIIHRAHRIIFTHYSLCNYFKRLYPSLGSKFRVVHNGVDTGFFTPDKKNYSNSSFDKLLKGFIEKYEYLIGYVGPIIREKGVDILIKSFREVNKVPGLSKRIGLVIVGPSRGYGASGYSAYHLALLDYVRRHGLDNVLFTGELDRETISYLYPRLDYLIQPFRFYEPLSLSAIESLASGTPIIAPCRGDAGLFIKAYSVGYCYIDDRITDAILEALYNRDHGMRVRARELALKLFSWNTIVDRLVSIYRELF